MSACFASRVNSLRTPRTTLAAQPRLPGTLRLGDVQRVRALMRQDRRGRVTRRAWHTPAASQGSRDSPPRTTGCRLDQRNRLFRPTPTVPGASRTDISRADERVLHLSTCLTLSTCRSTPESRRGSISRMTATRPTREMPSGSARIPVSSGWPFSVAILSTGRQSARFSGSSGRTCPGTSCPMDARDGPPTIPPPLCKCSACRARATGTCPCRWRAA